MKSLTVPVVCSQCGKTLRGREMLRGLGVHVSRHKRPDGRPCRGHLLSDHRRVAS